MPAPEPSLIARSRAPRLWLHLGPAHLARALFAIGMGLAAGTAQALQLIDARDGVTVEALLSSREPTRIRVEGAPITEVFGNIATNLCQPPATGSVGAALASPSANPAGELVLECDRDKGEIYVRPLPGSTKPVNLFIATAHATYTLVLRRSDTPADTIVLRDAGRPGTASGTSHAAARLGPSSNHIRAMKALLVAMSADTLPAEFRGEVVNQVRLLWTEARLVLVRRVEGRGLVGEHYLLHNVSGTDMVLAEPEFDRPDSGPGGQVLGVSIETHLLRPDETTRLFVIRRGGLQ